jgi:alpha-ribazole phosphatase
MTLHTDARLAEMDFGSWEGQAWSTIAPEAYEAWTADFAHHRVGGGESVALLMARVRQAWHDTLLTAQRHGERSALWLTHAGVIRAMQLLHSGIELPTLANDWPREAPDFGQWSVLHWPMPMHLNGY